jgi:hypothetical protein
MIKEKYAVERISPKILQEAIELFNKNQSVKRYNIKQFQFPANEYSIAVTARLNGKLIGFNATMNRVLYCAALNKTSNGVWSCDFMVSKQYQGHGIGKNIKKTLKSTISGQILSLGISDKALKLLSKNGWNTDISLVNYRKIITPRSTKGVAAYIVGKLIECSKLFINQSTPLLYFKFESMPLESEIDNLWERVKNLYSNTVIRNASYYQYRFDAKLASNVEFLVGRGVDGEVLSIYVFKQQGQIIEILDYLGDFTQKNNFVKGISSFSIYQNIDSINMNASHPVIIKSMIYSGFIKTKSFSSFAALNSNDLSNNHSLNNEWFLTSSDSDGELIKTIKDKPIDEPLFIHNNLTFYTISENEFSSIEILWNELLSTSEANHLFLNFQWVYNWWRIWKKDLAKKAVCKLFLIKIIDSQDNKVIGIIPLYKLLKKKFGMQYVEYQFLGNAVDTIPTVRSEYIKPIFLKNYTSACYKAFSAYIRSLPIKTKLLWPDSITTHYINLFPHRIKKIDKGYKVNTYESDYHQYIKSLGKNTKLKGISRLKKMDSTYKLVEWKRDIPVNEFFDELNKLHQLRWKKPCFDKKALLFHKALNQNENGFECDREILYIDKKVISANYNIYSNGTVYNIQSSFDQYFNKAFSFGTMHFLKCIKRAFAHQSVNHYDFLAGLGMNTDYKKRFKGSTVHFYTYEVYSHSFIANLVKYSVCIITFLRRLKDKICKNKISS